MKNIRLRALVGKLSVDPNLFAYDSLETVMKHVTEALVSPIKHIQERDGRKMYYWVLEPGEEFQYSDDAPVMVTGVIRRVTNLGAVETWDFEHNRPGEAKVRDMTLVKFHYLFDPTTEAVVVQQSGKTNAETLMAVFARLVDINTRVKLNNLSVNAYRKPELLEELAKFNRITRVRLALIAANPEQDEDFAEIEKLILSRPGAKKANIELMGDNLQKDKTIIDQGAHKVIRGQGTRLYVEGIGPDGQMHKVDSEDFTYTDTIKTQNSRRGISFGLYGILGRYIGGDSK